GSHVSIDQIDLIHDIEHVIQQFPTVRFTFNKNNGQLFLIGHVRNSIDKSELLYKVDALSFVKSVDDNVIDDEAVWQEMNILLSKNPEFKGISMQSPEPGIFVISGYLKTEEQAACLADYLNLHFNYLSLLDNKVIIESQVMKALAGHLVQSGFANVHVSFTNGEAVLTGYINNKDADKFRTVVQELQDIAGIRAVKNFVVLLPAEEGVIDLNMRYPG
uniref:Adenylate cyclase-like protein n=1 Tax=Chlamydia trachomatis serovar D (strain ATCC VR-885 / DSM 19411 / UW-3/Cx) TaxID=272561 RepID=UPI00065004D6|nr:Chain A, Adenylate cyclase-like protein [Chlamydia trachomatis D/UW-3/CX]